MINTYLKMGFAYNYFVLGDFFSSICLEFIKKHLPLQQSKNRK